MTQTRIWDVVEMSNNDWLFTSGCYTLHYRFVAILINNDLE